MRSRESVCGRCLHSLERLLALCVVLLLITTTSEPAEAQQALVLSGGGARGIAHAGVVRALDSLGVDPRIVVGTSMGAVVGALYATGLDGADVWSETVDQPWSRLFDPMAYADGPGGQVRAAVLRVHLGPGRSRSRKGFIPEWRINRRLSRIFLRPGVEAGGDFDRLPRRFRSVAVDLETGEAVVLGRGDLARAVRISMAIPGVFAVATEGGRILADGGVANYLPVGVARAMGAQTVVGSDVVRPTRPLDPLTPATIGSRGFRWLNVNARDDATRAERTIYPDLDPTVTSASFLSDTESIARDGYEAVLSFTDLPSRDDRTGDPVSAAPTSLAPDSIVGLSVTGAGPGLERLVRAAFPSLGEYDPERILLAADRLYATGLFDAVWPSVGLRDRAGGGERLVVAVEPVASSQVVGGGGYDSDRGGAVWGGIRHRSALSGIPLALTANGTLTEWMRAGNGKIDVFLPRLLPISVVAEGHVVETE
ncbi:MAG: patatin-like phospholipase family protein, partial [Gemmatimonadota bacterium]|nr:patatin-like phospholipase family protein [Gemmatimonadota bacterium]